MSTRNHAAAAALALVSGCHAQPEAPPPARQDVQTPPNVAESVQEPWQRPAAWIGVEAITAGRPGSVLVARDGATARVVEDSQAGYTIRETTVDCKRGTMRIERAHGYTFGMAAKRAPDPIGAIITPAGVRTLCAAGGTGPKRTPEEALKADMAKRGVAPRRPPDRSGER